MFSEYAVQGRGRGRNQDNGNLGSKSGWSAGVYHSITILSNFLAIVILQAG